VTNKARYLLEQKSWSAGATDSHIA